MGTFQIYIIGTLVALCIAGIPSAYFAGSWVERGKADYRCKLEQSAAVVKALTIQREALIKSSREEARNNEARGKALRQNAEGVNREYNCEKVLLSPCRRAFLERVQRMRDAQ